MLALSAKQFMQVHEIVSIFTRSYYNLTIKDFQADNV